MQFMMTDESGANDEMMGLHFRRVREVAMGMKFFHDYASQLPKKYLNKVSDPYYHAGYHLNDDLSMRVRDMLEGTERDGGKA